MAVPAGEIVDIGGVPAVPVKSTYQTDTVAFRFFSDPTCRSRDARTKGVYS